MKKSTVNLVNLLKENLLEFPFIVNSLEKKDINFLNRLFSWITKTEEILTTYSISQVSELSGLKSKIIAPKYSNERRVSVKKLQLKIASESLFDIQHIVLNVLTPLESKVEECRELIRQLLNIVSQTKTLTYDKDVPFENFINNIWQFISTNEQLNPGAVKLKTSLPMTDIKLLIADELSLEDF